MAEDTNPEQEVTLSPEEAMLKLLDTEDGTTDNIKAGEDTEAPKNSDQDTETDESVEDDDEENLGDQETVDANEEDGETEEFDPTQEDYDELLEYRAWREEAGLEGLEQVKSGHLMQADYTKKTTEVSTDREALTKEKEEVSGLRAQYIGQLEDVQGMLLGDLAQYEGVDWAKMKAEDNYEYMEKRTAYQEIVDRYNAADDLRQDQIEEAQKEQEAKFKTWVADEAKALAIAVPVFADEESAPALKKSVIEYGMNEGLTKEDLTLANHVAIKLIHKAMLYDALSSKKKVAQKKLKNKQGIVIKPGKPRSKQTISKEVVAKRRSKATQSGATEDDAAAAIADLF